MNIDFGSAGLIGFIVALLLSVGTHEAMHAYASHALGDTTASDMGRLTLNPLKHLDLYTSILLPILLVLSGLPPFFAAKPVPFNPNRVKYEEFGAALVGIAGPLTNFVLAAAGALVLRNFSGDMATWLFNFMGTFVLINVALFVFNMIPFPPLDGSRLLYAFAPEPLQRVMESIESAGFFAIVIFIFLLFPFLSPVVTTINDHIIRFLLL